MPLMIDELTEELNDTTKKAREALDKIAHLERMIEDLYARIDLGMEDIEQLERKLAQIQGIPDE